VCCFRGCAGLLLSGDALPEFTSIQAPRLRGEAVTR
jgi:hypothetical protein